MEVLETRQLPGGDRKLIATECGEFLVVDRQFGNVTRLKVFDQETAARADYKDTVIFKEPLACGGALTAISLGIEILIETSRASRQALVKNEKPKEQIQ